MNKLFKYANSIWVKYSDYVITETSDGIKYLQPAPKATPQPYDPKKIIAYGKRSMIAKSMRSIILTGNK